MAGTLCVRVGCGLLRSAQRSPLHSRTRNARTGSELHVRRATSSSRPLPRRSGVVVAAFPRLRALAARIGSTHREVAPRVFANAAASTDRECLRGQIRSSAFVTVKGTT